jgi:hypothetical protein
MDLERKDALAYLGNQAKGSRDSVDGRVSEV